jgi:integrase
MNGSGSGSSQRPEPTPPTTRFVGATLHETVIQRAVHRAARTAGIAKPVSPHTFGIPSTAHMLEDGYDIRTIQELLGHRDGEHDHEIHTPALNRGAGGVRSPLDR